MRQDGGYAIGDKVPMGKAIVYSLQHLMAFVGGGAIVPAMIMGLNPALAVFCTGLGTIIYLICTRNKVPSYFGVSFSFITPMAVVTAVDGISGALCGIVAVGVALCVVAGIVKLTGTGWIDKVLPPVVTGSVGHGGQLRDVRRRCVGDLRHDGLHCRIHHVPRGRGGIFLGSRLP